VREEGRRQAWRIGHDHDHDHDHGYDHGHDHGAGGEQG
jgi:hypothetical protein